MIQVTTIPELREWIAKIRGAGRRIGLVPTMGYLHQGHLALVDAVRQRNAAVVMSLFVNPLQFGPNEDLARYPRDLARDRRLAETRGVDVLFVPTEATMYPAGEEVRVVPGPSGERWEGAARPGHFAGVLTVVAKLFHLVQPDFACFGRKDIQQATLIRQMVRDLNWPLELVIVPTVREADGLALSSRNSYLTQEQRHEATALSAALRVAHQAWCEGETRAPELERRMRGSLAMTPGVKVEYIAVVEPTALALVDQADASTVVAIAARVGHTRLIDNIVLGEGLN